MKHFSSAEWADFARGLASLEDTAAMQSHLDEGCKKCERVLKTWQAVQSLAHRESDYEPPASALQAVESAFVIYGPRKRRSKAAEMAELIFDSFRQPLPAGVRSMEVATRKLLYRRGSLEIDLSLDPLAGTQSPSIDGQILDSSNPGKALSRIAVCLMSGKEKLAEVATNSFGEFHLECPVKENLRLSVWISADREVLLPLDQLIRTLSRGRS